MGRVLTTKQVLLLVAGGIVAAEAWVGLFGLWAVYDTPLLNFGFSVGLSAPAVRRISLSLFALASAILFTLPFLMFSRRGFLAAAAVFSVAFLVSFIVPAFFESEPLALLSFTLPDLGLFLLFFAACVCFVTVFRHT